jgi:hypothetical protein
MFFTRDIQSTYLKIIDFRTSLSFHMNVPVSMSCKMYWSSALGWIASTLDLRVIVLSAVYSRKPKFALAAHGTKGVKLDGTTWETLHSGMEVFFDSLTAISHGRIRAPSSWSSPFALHL